MYSTFVDGSGMANPSFLSPSILFDYAVEYTIL